LKQTGVNYVANWPDPGRIPMKITDPNPSAALVKKRAIEQLENHPYFKGRSQWVEMEFEEGTLRLKGRLPSFFLKQVVQEILRELPGVDRLDNEIIVASPSGDVGPNENRQRTDGSSNSSDRLLAHHLRPQSSARPIPR
jgi:osmotically-inducible protein OsmY